MQGADLYDEILGGDSIDGGVPEVRAQISSGDHIEVSGLSQVTFTRVSTPLVRTHTSVSLYAGTWVVGKNLGPGRYATPGAGLSGKFIITNEDVDEILGGSSDDGGVASETFSVKNGDTIEIGSLSQVMLSPS